MKTSDNRQEAVLDRILEKKGLVPQNTPDTEWEKEFYKILDEICGTSEWLITKEKRKGFCKRMGKALSSRDTYWKERVRKEINEISRHWIEEATRNPDNFEVRIKLDALDTLLDNLK